MPPVGAPTPLLPHTHHPSLVSVPSPSLSAFSFPLLLADPTEQESEEPHPLLRFSLSSPAFHPRDMELFFELVLTAAASLLVAFLLAKLFAANDPRPELHDRVAGPAAVIAEEKVEEEYEEGRIIEVDEVRVKGASADVAAPMVPEEWVEVEKDPAAVAAGTAEFLVEEEGVPERIAPELFLGAVLVKEEGEVGKEQCDLTSAAAATETAIEAKLRDLGAEAALEEILDVELAKESVPQHDLGATGAPSEILGARLQNQDVQAIEAVEVKQHYLVGGPAPAEVIDAELEEEHAQAMEVSPHELARETVPGEVLDVVFEKQEKQVIEVNQHELAAEVAPVAILNVALAEEKELKEQPVEKVVDAHEEAQDKEKAKCEARLVDHQEELAPKEELVVRKTDDLEVSQEGNSNDKVVVQLPEKEVALPEMPEDEARAYMELEEWEGIERSEVEKRFGAAAAFAASDAGAAALSKLGSDVQLQLQGLLKVAVDGPCYDSTQPLTLRPSSRAKWVAWQKLGDMHPEIAMEKYMNLLSEIIPGWMGDKSSDTKKHEADGDSERPILTTTSYTSDRHNNQGNEDSTSMDEGPLTSPPNPEKGQSSDVPAE